MTKENKVMVKFLAPFLLLAFLTAFGCANKNFVENGYDSISTLNNSVDTLMVELGKKYRAGEITESQKEKISEVYNKLRAASDAADTALAMYATAQSEETQEEFENKYYKAMAELEKNREVFMELASQFLEVKNE